MGRRGKVRGETWEEEQNCQEEEEQGAMNPREKNRGGPAKGKGTREDHGERARGHLKREQGASKGGEGGETGRKL